MYRVRDFSPDVLSSLAANCVEDDIRKAVHGETKSHLGYLSDYLDAIGCEQIVLEEEYVDRDYLTDYAGYYARSFQDYPRFCSRLHFFGEGFSQDDFENWVRGKKEELDDTLSDHYLGYIVLKPLPETFIGRTCLRTYGPDGGRRNFPTTRLYESHIAGFGLEIDSLAFQEQDKVAAACATSAIWSSLHKAGEMFGTPIPTPVDITTSAADRSMGRALPSQGLTLEQMCWAIKETGLEVELRQGSKVEDFKGLIYGYNKAGLAPILGLQLFDSNEEFEGHHAVTVTGFSLPDNSPDTWLSAGLDELYVHDDQVGPFARVEFDANRSLASDKGVGPNLALKTQFPVENQPAVGVVSSVVIPVYEKIRVPFEDARTQLNALNALTSLANKLLPQGFPFQPTWDLHLTTVSEFRADVRQDLDMPPGLTETVLTTNYPRFLWRAIGREDGDAKVDVLIDATDIHRSYLIRTIFFRDEALGERLVQFLDIDFFRDIVTRVLPKTWTCEVTDSIHKQWE